MVEQVVGPPVAAVGVVCWGLLVVGAAVASRAAARAYRRSQQIRSTAMVIAAHQAWLTVQDWGKPVEAGVFGGPYAVFDAGVRAVAGVGALYRYRPGSQSWGVGDEGGVFVAAGVELGGLFERQQLAAAYDKAHRCRPAQLREPLAESVGDLGALQTVDHGAGGVGQARYPAVAGQAVRGDAHVVVDVEPDRVRRATRLAAGDRPSYGIADPSTMHRRPSAQIIGDLQGNPPGRAARSRDRAGLSGRNASSIAVPLSR
jgi:hypothetical protein